MRYQGSVSRDLGKKGARADAAVGVKGARGDRPPILPWAAIPAYAIWFLLMGIAAAEIAALLPYATAGIPFSYKLQEIILVSAIVLLIMIGMRYGKLWSIRLFRYFSYVVATFHLPILAAAFYLRASKGALQVDPHAPILGGMILVFSVLELPGLFVLFRALRRVRWLDSDSLPHEWEPPADFGR